MKTTTLFIIFLTLPALAYAYSGNPPNGKTGAPGEGTCHDCHMNYPLNSGDGAFTILGPEQFAPGETHDITVQLSDPDQSRWGFELTPLTLGTITITDPTNTQLGIENGKSYVKQTSAGTYNGTPNGPVSWSFDWTAPSEPPDTIIFYAAGTAADGNGMPPGDYVYTTTFTTTLQPSIVIDDDFAGFPTEFALIGNYPNPFNARTLISYQLPVASSVKLEIFNLLGSKVATLVDGEQGAGYKSVTWEASKVASGVYFYKLTAGDYTEAKRMMLVK
ncbi:MAG: choice-of-anchor V domain-containing protein [Candidatus Zixiibacteriota bacterium]